MKKRYYLLVILLIVVILGFFIFIEYFYFKEAHDITTKEGCEQLNGKWEKIGLNIEEECNLPTSDFGNVCYDRSDCEGECIAELDNEEVKRIIEQPVLKNGKCSEYRIVAGCNYFVDNGIVNDMICID